MERHTGTFKGVGDDGKQYTLLVYTKIIAAGHMQDASATIRDVKRVTTDQGEALNVITKGVYQTVARDKPVTIRCSDPNAL